jgi:hypothetical protein
VSSHTCSQLCTCCSLPVVPDDMHAILCCLVLTTNAAHATHQLGSRRAVTLVLMQPPWSSSTRHLPLVTLYVHFIM